LPSKYAYVDGTAVHYSHCGVSTLPGVVPRIDRGRLLLFLHDAGGNAGMWEDQLGLCSASHSPITFDFPGHGRSGGTESLKSVETYSDFLIALIETLDLPASVLVGHGMGASIAIETTARAPRRVSALVLVGAAERPQITNETLRTWENVMRGRAPQPFTTEAFCPKTDFAVMRKAWMEQVKTDPRVRYFDLLAWSRYEAKPRLGSIGVPTLIVTAGDDAMTSPAQAADLRRSIPGSDLVSVDNAGHMLPLEKPAELAEAINSKL
jgi:3-oxoadipate enol-lactonase/4-carboxymuconolactone decarboxylase